MSVEIETRSLDKVFGRRCALREVNLKVGREDFLLIIGPNGASMITLLRCLARLIMTGATPTGLPQAEVTSSQGAMLRSSCCRL
jgi:ABC-type phosphate/phosphonate transport system ATPase subunit